MTSDIIPDGGDYVKQQHSKNNWSDNLWTKHFMTIMDVSYTLQSDVACVTIWVLNRDLKSIASWPVPVARNKGLTKPYSKFHVDCTSGR